jgi:Flp pilus assembly pilin Flp
MMTIRQPAPRNEKLPSHRKGATLVEYCLMLALLAFACLGFATLIGTTLSSMYQTVVGALSP